jgi:hypothetical protein
MLLLTHLFIFSENILFVKDGCSFDVYSYYIERIRHIDSTTLDTQKDNITFEVLREYDAVFWLCGDSQLTLSDDEKQMLDKYIKTGDKGLFIEGEFLLYDSAFIDNGFFFRKNFNIKYLSNNYGSIEVSTDWANPITWGMNERFTINSLSRIDVMSFDGWDERSVILKVNEEYNRDKETKCVGVGVDHYNYRVALLSFSPALRNVWEIDTSTMINNLADWLTLSGREIIERIVSRQDFRESYSELLLRRIITAFEIEIYTEFDFMQENYREGVFPEYIYKYIFENLKGKFIEDEDWQKNIEISQRLGID